MSLRRGLEDVLAERADDNPLGLTDGVVTSVNADGTVGLSVDGAEDVDAATLTSYTGRAVGDVVAVLRQDRRMVVLGKYDRRDV